MSSQNTSSRRTLALVGQPNVGKSVVFHALTGKYVTVSNFPGTTVDLSRGVGHWGGQDWMVYDSPGVFSLVPRTDDERVTRDLGLSGDVDVVVQVADAKNLSKSLHLTLELAEFGCPMVLVLNMMDEARDKGIALDIKQLSKRLGIPVVETVAIDGEGIDVLKESLGRAAVPREKPRYDAALLKEFENIAPLFSADAHAARAITVSFFANDKAAWSHAVRYVESGRMGELESSIKKIQKTFVRSPEMLLFEGKQAVVQNIVGEVLSRQEKGKTNWLGILGTWAMKPFPGYLMALGVLWGMYQFVGVFGADTLVGFLEDTVFGAYINPLVTKIVELVFPWAFLRDILVGPYGTFTMALTYALALILPIVSTFFLFFGILEDSGYLPRLAVMMDRFFRLMGLNGRAVLPMILGLGCDTMAVVTTRILDTRKEKIIVSLLLTLSVPCSAQLAAILGMSAGISSKVLLIWFVVVAGTMMLVGWGASQFLPGARAPFLVELPPMRWPKLSNIYKKVKARLKWYIKEVIPLFVLATFVLYVIDKLGILTWVEQAASPIVETFLGLPRKATEAFIVGFFRRDYGAAGFFQLAKEGLLSDRQVAVSIVVITLFMPCVAQLLITLKERGAKATIGIVSFVLSFSLAVGGALNWILTRWSIL